MNNKISIIIPAYNSEKYIERTIKSITGQTYTNLEVIVVDDGSTDNTLNLCTEISKNDDRILVFHKDNEGVTKARDFGIRKATGDYIGFVDSDDTIDSNMYEVLYNNMLKYDADISHCGHIYISNNYDKNCMNNENYKIYVHNQSEGIINIITGEKVGPSLCTKLYKKSMFYGLEYDRNMKINEDYVINLLLFSKANKSVFYDKPLYNYYQNDNSGSTKLTKKYFYEDMLNAANLTKSMFKGSDKIYPFAERRWFRILSTMYRNQGSMKNVEFDYRPFFETIRNQIKDESDALKNNSYFTKSERFVLYMILYFPKLLIFLFKFR